MLSTLAPEPASLSDTLPTDRLFRSGKARPGVLPSLRTIPARRNMAAAAALWAQIIGSWSLVRLNDHPLVWILVAAWMGRCFSLVFLLNHEAAHALLLNNRTWNDRIGRYLLAWPALLDFDGYRTAHLAHHKDELGPDEPDMGLYVGYPTHPTRLLRRLGRDAAGRSAWKQLRAMTKHRGTPLFGILTSQVAMTVLAFITTGKWWAIAVLWWLPWATLWQVINRLRAITEHAGMAPGPDRRRNTHVVRQHWLSSQILVPFNSGYHLAHHVDTSLPWTNLPTMHLELESAGWITDDLTHSSYPAIWRYLTTIRPSRPPRSKRESAPAGGES